MKSLSGHHYQMSAEIKLEQTFKMHFLNFIFHQNGILCYPLVVTVIKRVARENKRGNWFRI